MIKYGTYKIFKHKETEEVVRIPLTTFADLDQFEKSAEWEEVLNEHED